MPVLTLLNETLAAAVTAGVYGEQNVNVDHVQSLTIFAEFVRVGGGATAKAWVQTSIDGTNWLDIANFAATTTSLNRAFTLTTTAVTSIVTPTDGSLADNTAVNGLLGKAFRVKLTTTGTYTGASFFKITAVAK